MENNEKHVHVRMHTAAAAATAAKRSDRSVINEIWKKTEESRKNRAQHKPEYIRPKEKEFEFDKAHRYEFKMNSMCLDELN